MQDSFVVALRQNSGGYQIGGVGLYYDLAVLVEMPEGGRGEGCLECINHSLLGRVSIQNIGPS